MLCLILERFRLPLLFNLSYVDARWIAPNVGGAIVGQAVSASHIRHDRRSRTMILMSQFDRWRKSCFGILENGLVISCPDITKWIEWMRESSAAGNYIVAEDEVGGFLVVTEFLGINHNATGAGPPLWFETLVFRESADGNLGVKIEFGTVRYSTLADATVGHVVICEKVKTGGIEE